MPNFQGAASGAITGANAQAVLATDNPASITASLPGRPVSTAQGMRQGNRPTVKINAGDPEYAQMLELVKAAATRISSAQVQAVVSAVQDAPPAS